VVRPDLIVVCGDQPERHLERPPGVAVEVLSDSTKGQDLTIKRDLYLESGVQHYLVVDPDGRTLTHFTCQDSCPASAEDTIQIPLGGDNNLVADVDCGRPFDPLG
jgi:Uma2 family endonuclease